MPTRKDEETGGRFSERVTRCTATLHRSTGLASAICGGRLRRRWLASIAGTSGAVEPLNKHAAENRTKRRSKWKDTGCLIDQVDLAGNRTGSDQLFGWRDENRLR